MSNPNYENTASRAEQDLENLRNGSIIVGLGALAVGGIFENPEAFVVGGISLVYSGIVEMCRRLVFKSPNED